MPTILFSYVLIPLSTLFLSRGTSLFHTNFSSIRTVLERQGEFLLWGLLTGGYFFLSLRALIGRLDADRGGLPVSKSCLRILLSASLWGMILFLAIPYRPEDAPVSSALHVGFALLASCLFLLCLFFFVMEIYWQDADRGRPLLLLLLIAVTACLASWILSGIINTAMEICLVFTGCYLIRRFWILLPKRGNTP